MTESSITCVHGTPLTDEPTCKECMDIEHATHIAERAINLAIYIMRTMAAAPKLESLMLLQGRLAEQFVELGAHSMRAAIAPSQPASTHEKDEDAYALICTLHEAL